MLMAYESHDFDSGAVTEERQDCDDSGRSQPLKCVRESSFSGSPVE
jgi:hypothetical protein